MILIDLQKAFDRIFESLDKVVQIIFCAMKVVQCTLSSITLDVH